MDDSVNVIKFLVCRSHMNFVAYSFIYAYRYIRLWIYSLFVNAHRCYSFFVFQKNIFEICSLVIFLLITLFSLMYLLIMVIRYLHYYIFFRVKQNMLIQPEYFGSILYVSQIISSKCIPLFLVWIALKVLTRYARKITIYEFVEHLPKNQNRLIIFYTVFNWIETPLF